MKWGVRRFAGQWICGEIMDSSDVETARLSDLVEKGKVHLKDYGNGANVIHAQKCFSEAYTLSVSHFGKNDVRNIEILSLLAASHKYHIGLEKSSTEVIGLLEEMKRIQILNFGTKNSDLIETYKRLATSYAQTRKFESALENYFRALGFRVKRDRGLMRTPLIL